MSEEHTNPFPPPIDDEGLERWVVQFQYAGKVVIGPIERTEFGAILARLRLAESDRSRLVEEKASLAGDFNANQLARLEVEKKLYYARQEIDRLRKETP